MCLLHLSDAILFGLLNQVRASHRPARAWFLKIVPVRTSVCVFVCVSAPRANNK